MILNNVIRRKALFGLLSVVLMMALNTLPLYAQNESFRASASKTTVGVNEQFQVTFTFNGNGRDFQAPVFKDFSVLMGPSTSNSIQFINGNMSQSLSYTYVLQARSEGTFQIGSAHIKGNGKTYQSNTLSIKVVKGTPQNNQAQNNQGDSNADIMSQIDKNLFIKVHVDKTNVYQGEAVTVTYKLYSRVSLVNFSLTKMPTLNGFWSQEFDAPKQLQLHGEVVDGVEYQVADLKKVILFPQYSGNLTLDPMEGESVVRIQKKRQSSRGYDPFEDFFNDPFFGGGFQDVEFKVKSQPLSIKVKPLPDNAPQSFSGAVGNFSMSATLDKPETKANEPVTLKIKISGKGNLKLIDPFKLNLPPDIETYDPKISDNISVGANGVSGSRTFEYLLIPRHAGNYKIPAFDFSYFSIDKNRYISLPSDEIALNVLKGNGESAGGGISGINKEEVQLLGKDIKFIKTNNPSLSPSGKFFFGSALFYGLLAFPVLAFFAFMVYRKKYMEENANESLVRSRKANSMARKRLAQAKKYLNEKKSEPFHEELSKALWGYISHKLSITVSDLSKETIAEKLKQKSVDESSIQKLIALLDHCEFIRYAPSVGSSEMDVTYEKSIEVISDIEQQLKTVGKNKLKTSAV